MSFDRLAPHYGWMETMLAGRVLQRARTVHLPLLASARCVLVAGEGPGRFLEAALQAAPNATFTCLDASPTMLAQACRRVGADPRVTFVNASLPEWSPTGTGRHDVIATHCFLDCFDPPTLRRVIASLSAAATDDAIWLLTDFAIPPSGWRRWRARLVHRAMYAFFRLATSLPARRLTPPDAALHAAGFRLVARQHWQHGLIQSDCWIRR